MYKSTNYKIRCVFKIIFLPGNERIIVQFHILIIMMIILIEILRCPRIRNLKTEQLHLIKLKEIILVTNIS